MVSKFDSHFFNMSVDKETIGYKSLADFSTCKLNLGLLIETVKAEVYP